jgi:ketol-acid reductoisomerase
LHAEGIDGMRRRISRTAAYGGLTRGRRLIDQRTRGEMARILAEIETGQYASEFLTRGADPTLGLEPLAAQEEASRLARTGRALRQRLQALRLQDREQS